MIELVREAIPVEVSWTIDVYGELAILTIVDVEVETRVKVTRFPAKPCQNLFVRHLNPIAGKGFLPETVELKTVLRTVEVVRVIS